MAAPDEDENSCHPNPEFLPPEKRKKEKNREGGEEIKILNIGRNELHPYIKNLSIKLY